MGSLGGCKGVGLMELRFGLVSIFGLRDVGWLPTKDCESNGDILTLGLSISNPDALLAPEETRGGFARLLAAENLTSSDAVVDVARFRAAFVHLHCVKCSRLQG